MVRTSQRREPGSQTPLHDVCEFLRTAHRHHATELAELRRATASGQGKEGRAHLRFSALAPRRSNWLQGYSDTVGLHGGILPDCRTEPIMDAFHACRFGRAGSTVGGDRHEYWETLRRPRELLKL